MKNGVFFWMRSAFILFVFSFIDYKPTSLEMEYKYEVQCEMDIGLNLDLIDPNTYKVDSNAEIQVC